MSPKFNSTRAATFDTNSCENLFWPFLRSREKIRFPTKRKDISALGDMFDQSGFGKEMGLCNIETCTNLDSEYMHQRRMVVLSADLPDFPETIDIYCTQNDFCFVSFTDCVALGRRIMPREIHRCILCGRSDHRAQSLFTTIGCVAQDRRVRGGY